MVVQLKFAIKFAQICELKLRCDCNDFAGVVIWTFVL